MAINHKSPSQLMIKTLLAIAFAMTCACAPSNNKTAPVQVPNPSLSPSELASENTLDGLICFSNEIEIRLSACQLSPEQSKKLGNEMPQWSSQSGYWSPELLKAKSIRNRHQLNDAISDCLIQKFCK